VRRETHSGKTRTGVTRLRSALIEAAHADDIDYADLGPRYFDERDEQHVSRRLIRRYCT
jgi:hypothetical protein